MEAQARLRRLRRQTILSLAVASAAVLTGPASALGAGAGVSNGVLFFTGSGTEANRLTLSQDAGKRASLSTAASGQRVAEAKTSRRGRTIIKKKRWKRGRR